MVNKVKNMFALTEDEPRCHVEELRDRLDGSALRARQVHPVDAHQLPHICFLVYSIDNFSNAFFNLSIFSSSSYLISLFIFSKYISNTLISAGDTPEIREA